MSKFTLFLQFEGSDRIELIEMPVHASGEDLIAAALALGMAAELAEAAHVFSEHHHEPLHRHLPLAEQGHKDKGRLHIHRCRQIEVSFRFNDFAATHPFTPTTTVQHAKDWLVKQIRMSPVDATEHVLQIAGTDRRPDPDDHLGSFVSGCCSVAFVLVPRKRVEG